MSPRVPVDHQRSPSIVSMAFLSHSVLSLRRNQVSSMDVDEVADLDLFQSFVSNHLLSLLSHHPLSFSFLQSLLDTFLSSLDEFKNLLSRNPTTILAKSPLDHHLTDLIDRSLKCLDKLNAVRHSLQSLRHWNRHADIASSASKNLHLSRTKKALSSLLALSSPVQETSTKKTERAWSFRCKAAAKEETMQKSLAAPRAGETGLAVAVYTMSSVMVFTTWALAAFFPSCNLVVIGPVVPGKQVVWGAAMVGLEERIGEEGRRRRGRMLEEVVGVERIANEMMELLVEEEEGIAEKGEELWRESRRLEEGVEVFERQVREVFHRVVESRAEVIKFLEIATKSAPPFFVL